MNDFPPEVILSIVTGIGGFLMRMTAQRQSDFIDLVRIGMDQNNNHNEPTCNKREVQKKQPILRKIIAILIIVICFGGLLAVAFRPDIPVSIVEPVAQKELLWGLVKWGKPLEVITANGFVFPSWIKYSVISVVSFLFGTGAAKISK